MLWIEYFGSRYWLAGDSISGPRLPFTVYSLPLDDHKAKRPEEKSWGQGGSANGAEFPISLVSCAACIPHTLFPMTMRRAVPDNRVNACEPYSTALYTHPSRTVRDARRRP